MNLKSVTLLLCCTVGFLYGEVEDSTPVDPVKLEKKLVQAEKDFERAQKMFDPYYTGPLLAPGVTIPGPGQFAFQPYFFFTTTYGYYDDSGHSHSIPNVYSLEVDPLLFVGITKWLGLQAAAGYVTNKQGGNRGSYWTDPSLTLLFPIVKETSHRPGILLGVRESFPVGRYQHLSPNKGGVDATGSGAYRTSFFFNIAKIFWTVPTHPMRARLSLQYKLPRHVHVSDFNTYGGGYCTDGKVKLPNALSADFGYEFSFTQKWVFALDVVYDYRGKINFSGFPGIGLDCACASVGAGSGQQLSLAPAIEYNVNAASGLIFGPWFTVWGKNTSQFAAAVFSFYVSW